MKFYLGLNSPKLGWILYILYLAYMLNTSQKGGPHSIWVPHSQGGICQVPHREVGPTVCGSHLLLRYLAYMRGTGYTASLGCRHSFLKLLRFVLLYLARKFNLNIWTTQKLEYNSDF